MKTMNKTLLFSIGVVLSVVIGNSFVSAQQMDARMEFKPSLTEARVGDEFDVEVMLSNPGLQSIISVRAWLSYNPDILEGLSVDTEGTPFTLSAPGESEVSQNEGLIKLGRSNISGGSSEAEVQVATVRFRVKTPYAVQATIEPHNYQINELGHTSVNIIDQGFPVNILGQEPETALINLNPGAAPYGSDDATPTQTEVIVNGFGFANLMRPENLRVMTGPGYADLKWDFSQEAELRGYNLYYGRTSGQYTRRRTLGPVNQYRLDGLNNNEVYYFSITAYDPDSRESDYSDEVAIIINVPLSSTAPFENFSDSLLAQIPASPQNGPLVGWLAFSAFGLGGTLAFRKKTKLKIS